VLKPDVTLRAQSRRPIAVLVALAGIELIALTVLALEGTFHLETVLAAYGIAFVAYVGVLVVVHRAAPPVWITLALALFLRIPWLPTVPTLSDDVWRYLHDGRAQLAGVNPYRFAPAAPEASAYAGPEHPLINHPELPTVYPPAAQVTFLVAAVLGPGLLSWKIVLLLFELMLAAGIVRFLRARHRPPGGVAAYLLHPLPVIEFAGNAHVDVVAIATLVLALALLLERRPVAAGIALTFSIAAKYLAVPVAVFGTRDLLGTARRGFLLVGAITLIILYVPYLGASTLGSLGTYARSFEFNGSVYRIATAVLPPLAARVALAGVLLGILAFLWRVRADSERAAFVWIAALLLVSPIVHPWYLIWLIPFLAWRRDWWVVAWTGTVVLTYSVLPRWLAEGVWELPAWVPWVEYVPVIVLLVWQVGIHRLAPRLALANPASLDAPGP
jgi:hypothetical protein